MSKRYPGGYLTASPVVPTATSAPGVWTLEQQYQANGAGNWPAAANYQINKSLRFRSSASAYLNRTPASASNQTTWTFSAWVKRGELSASGTYTLLSATSASPESRTIITFEADGSLDFFYYNGSTYPFITQTSAVYRDPASWYHVVVAYDSTQATSTNRIKMYVNGSQITAFQTATYPSQNGTSDINSTKVHNIGRRGAAGNDRYYDGYMAEINFIDGVAWTPSAFGTTDAYGIWQPIPFAGSYGTNGYYLPFTNTTSTTTLGYDSSGNGNNWTTNNLSLTAGSTYDSMYDSPTNNSSTIANYCTFNPIVYNAGSVSYSNGNLLFTMSANADRFNIGTLCAPTGKFYWELTVSAINQSAGLGIGISKQTQIANGPWVSSGGPNTLFFNTNSGWNVYGTNLGTGALGTFANNDVIGVAMDMVNNVVYIYQNNTLLTSLSGYIDLNTPHTLFVDSYYNGSSVALNCGQQPFVYTPPTGFNRLNTYNLPDSTLPVGGRAMTATTYSGTGTSTTYSNASTGSTGFYPDFTWIKARNDTTWHQAFDSIRGTNKGLFPNDVYQEVTETDAFNSFTSTGFTLGADVAGGSVNKSGNTYVAWQWNANNGSTSSNTNGTITSTVSVNPTAGFSIVTYTGNGTASSTVGHGLGVTPNFIIAKVRSTTESWPVFHTSLLSLGTGYFLELDVSGDASNGNSRYPSAPNSTVVTIGSAGNLTPINASGQTYVMYCWNAVAGYSAFGSYTGNGSTDGPFIYCGFRPKYILIKATAASGGSTQSWCVLDTARDTYNVASDTLYPDTTAVEDVYPRLDFLSNGVKHRSIGNAFNGSGVLYIYAAFAENPFKIARAR